MPRQPRVHLPGLALHIVQRGHNRQSCFFAESDYERYLHWLHEALEATGSSLHAYVLMTNHVHLLLTPNDDKSVPELMMSLGRRYVRSVNVRYGLTGTLWDSRYRSSLVASDAYFLACQRYIELNPVRARMVADPAEYRWSSFRCNALGWPDRRVVPHPTYLALGDTGAKRQRLYFDMLTSGINAEDLAGIRQAVNQGRPIGSEEFLDAVSRLVGEDVRSRPRGRPKN